MKHNNLQSKQVLRQEFLTISVPLKTNFFANVCHITVIYILRGVQLLYLVDYEIKFSKSRPASDPAIPAEQNPPPGNSSKVPPHTNLQEK